MHPLDRRRRSRTDAHNKGGRTRRERGAAALEFALVAPLFFLVVFGGIEIGLMFRSHLAIQDMSRGAARVASIERDSADADREILQGIVSGSRALNGEVTKVIIFHATTLDASTDSTFQRVKAGCAMHTTPPLQMSLQEPAPSKPV
jgi:Flp pilus assembly protein TadG